MFYMIRELSSRHRIHLVTFIDDEPPPHVDRIRALCAEVRIVPRLTRRCPLPPTVTPNTVWIDFDSPAFDREVESVRAVHPIDIAAVEYEVMAGHIPPGLPAVLTVHELQSFAAWRRGRRASGVARLREWGQMLKWLNHERRMFPRYRRLVTITEREKRLIRACLPRVPVEVVPTGTDGSYFTPVKNAPRPGACVFVGNFLHHPNEDAMRWFCGDILPRLRRRVPAARIDIVGYRSREVLPDLVGTPGVNVAGQVEDIRPWLAAARVFVNPVRLGSGMRGKLFDAFAMARPAVSTSLGVQGLEHLRGVCVVVADDPEDFARAAAELLESPERGAAMGGAARAAFDEGYDWRTLARRYEAVLERVASEGRNR